MNFNVDDDINNMNRTLTKLKALKRRERGDRHTILKSSIDVFPSLKADDK
jgi:hypothetical protein